LRSRAVRVTLTLLAVVIVAAAAYLFWNFERRAAQITTSARALDTRVSTAVRQAFDLRSAQQAYVSIGQNEQFWITKVAASITALRESLTVLQSTSTSPSARVAMDGALLALKEFETIDTRAREYATTEQKLLASDLIFSDGLERTEEIVAALEQTRYVEAENASASRTALRRDQVFYAAGSAALTLLIMVLLTPPSKDVERQPEPVLSPRAIALGDDVEEFEFRPARPAAGASASPPPSTPAPAPAVLSAIEEPIVSVGSQSGAPVETATPVLPDLEVVANVCTELARLTDTMSLSTLLERTATVLDASGVMLWVADPDGRELTAIAAHGYRPNMLARVGTIKRDAENVTAAAFRTGLVQTVKANGTASGAIAAPLVNPSGCIGVMSAEVLHEAEKEPARLAVAAIVAAQLATLVAPASRIPSKSNAI
jgi:hypothetical protein